MTNKQKAFVDQYMIDHDATNAAIRAGYSPKTASQIGCRLVKKSQVSQEIEKRIAWQRTAAGWNADRVINGLAEIAESAPKQGDRVKAYDLIGKYLHLWQDKVELSGGVQIAPESIKAIADTLHGQRDVTQLADQLGVRHD